MILDTDKQSSFSNFDSEKLSSNSKDKIEKDDSTVIHGSDHLNQDKDESKDNKSNTTQHLATRQQAKQIFVNSLDWIIAKNYWF